MKYSLSPSRSNECALCVEIGGRINSRAVDIFEEADGWPIEVVATENYLVIPSLGPLVFGHCLIVTRSHESSVMLDACKEGRYEELRLIGERMEIVLEKITGRTRFLYFEHGSTENTVELCSTSHAHLHVLPLETQEYCKLLPRMERMFDLVSHEKAIELSLVSGDFILVNARDKLEKLTESQWYFGNAQGLKSQFMRHTIAEVLGIEYWNWKVDKRRDLLVELVDEVKKIGTG